MTWEQNFRRVFLAVVAFLVADASLKGDTIVLKNGRRISALSVTQEGDKVSYETPSGTLTLPRSIVDHVERGGVPSVDGRAAEGSANAATLSLKPPETADSAALSPNKDEIEKRVIQDSEVDRGYVARLKKKRGRAKRWPIKMRRWPITRLRNSSLPMERWTWRLRTNVRH